MRRILKWTILPIASIYLLLCVALYLHQSKFIFIPQRQVEFTPRDFGCEFEDIQFASADGKSQLHGWWIVNNSGVNPQLTAKQDNEQILEQKDDEAERRSAQEEASDSSAEQESEQQP